MALFFTQGEGNRDLEPMDMESLYFATALCGILTFAAVAAFCAEKCRGRCRRRRRRTVIAAAQ